MSERKALVSWLAPSFIVLLVLVLWGGSWVMLCNDPNRGTFGDMFGAVNALFSGLAFAGVVYAILLQRKDLELQKQDLEKRDLEVASKSYLENAILLLERSYEVLSDLDLNGFPKNKRMNWLASARFLRASEKMKELITEEHHRNIYKEHLEYWRAKLHDLILPDQLGGDGFPSTYFAEKPEHMFVYGLKDQKPLSLKSLATLYRFVMPREFEDRLTEVQKFTAEEIEKMCMFGPRGLGHLLEAVEQIKEKRIKDKEGDRPIDDLGE